MFVEEAESVSPVSKTPLASTVRPAGMDTTDRPRYTRVLQYYSTTVLLINLRVIVCCMLPLTDVPVCVCRSLHIHTPRVLNVTVISEGPSLLSARETIHSQVTRAVVMVMLGGQCKSLQ